MAGLGGLDVLVNNAGVGEGGQVEDCNEGTWDRTLDTNLKGVIFVTQRALPHLRAAQGNIVNVASVDGPRGIPGGSIYSASKAGVITMTRAHALEFAPGARVNARYPGFIDTDMPRGAATRAGGSVGEGYRVFAETGAAQKRIAHVKEVAEPVLYLASDSAGFATGCIHVADGGETIDGAGQPAPSARAAY